MSPSRASEAETWIRRYGYILIVAALYGITVAHLPVILGHQWAVCVIDGSTSVPCVLTIHLYDAALTIFLLWFGWYSVRRVGCRRWDAYRALLLMALIIEMAFFTFEAVQLLWNFHNGAATWENYIIGSIALILLGGFLLGAFVHQRVLSLSRQECTGLRIGHMTPGEDGLYYPRNEADIVELIAYARTNGLQLRCRGAAHSVARSIYTDPGLGDPPIPNQVTHEAPPCGPNINVMLDHLNDFVWVDREKGIAEVGAGIHLGADPYDPGGTAHLENSLLFQAWQAGWALNDLGGITHQTVSGFTATGSAGGSLKYDLARNLAAFRVVDGTGNAEWIERDDDRFGAIALSLGLLGVITRVRLELSPTYNIEGDQVTVAIDDPDCPVDLLGGGGSDQPSLADFFRQTPYTRLLWWPQKGKAERLVVWKAHRVEGTTRWPDKTLEPYREFPQNVIGQVEQMAGAILFTLLGNRGFFRVWSKLMPGFDQFRKNVSRLWRKSMGVFLAAVLSTLLTTLVVLVGFLLVLIFTPLKFVLRMLFATILGFFQGMTKDGKAERFRDIYWSSLPMDNSAGDVLMGTGFTELFIPLSHTERAMKLLDDWYRREGTSATGYYSTELYAGHRSNRWLHPAYASGEYEEGCTRVDFFWYKNNQGIPNAKDGFFAQFWSLFRDNGIPFRLHWGKYVPDYDHADWAAYYRSQLPRWDDFLALREMRDPDDIFLTAYWRRHLFGET